MTLFDISRPGVKAISSVMGGGWVVPINDSGEDVLERFFEEEPTPIGPLGGVKGYIVEPNQSGDLAEYLRDAGVAWVVE